MAGAIYKAEFVVTEQSISQDPHKKVSNTSKEDISSNLAGNGKTLGAVAKKMLPKLSVAVVASAAIKTGQFIYNTVTTQKANSAMISGDTVAYKQLQNQQTIVNNSISIASSIAMAAVAGATVGSIVPGLGTAVGAAVGAGVAAISQGVSQLMKIPEYVEKKRVFQANAQIEQTVNNLDRERFGTNAKTFR